MTTITVARVTTATRDTTVDTINTSQVSERSQEMSHGVLVDYLKVLFIGFVNPRQGYKQCAIVLGHTRNSLQYLRLYRVKTVQHYMYKQKKKREKHDTCQKTSTPLFLLNGLMVSIKVFRIIMRPYIFTSQTLVMTTATGAAKVMGAATSTTMTVGVGTARPRQATTMVRTKPFTQTQQSQVAHRGCSKVCGEQVLSLKTCSSGRLDWCCATTKIKSP